MKHRVELYMEQAAASEQAGRVYKDTGAGGTP